MQFQTITPPEGLRSLVKSCWVIQDDGVGPMQKTFHTIADGSPGLIFHRSQEGEPLRQFGKSLPSVFLYGQGTGYSEIVSPGRLNLMGIYLQPHALRTIFGLDSVEITNSCLDLDEIASKYDDSLSDRLFDAASTLRQTQIINDFLLLMLSKNASKEDFATRYAISKINEKQGKITLGELHRALNLSERSLQRRFLQNIGVPPKLYLRIHRFQNSLAQIRRQGYDKLTDIAYDNDYADQSHFLRDFKEFTGFAPSQYLKRSREVVANFSQVDC